MDYEFSYDDYGQPIAKFSVGHEAIGRWFSEEIGNDAPAIEKLLAMLRHSGPRSQQWLGAEFQLRIAQDEVEVVALALGIDVDEALPEDTNLYDAESYSGCGLQDFTVALRAWQTFVS